MSFWKITVSSVFSVMRLPDQSNLKETVYWATVRLRSISVDKPDGRDGKQLFIPSQEQGTMS